MKHVWEGPIAGGHTEHGIAWQGFVCARCGRVAKMTRQGVVLAHADALYGTWAPNQGIVEMPPCGPVVVPTIDVPPPAPMGALDRLTASLRAQAVDPDTRQHVHTWEPIPQHQGRYRCACGVTGYRKGPDIVPHKATMKRNRETIHIGDDNLGNGNARRGRHGPGSY